MAQKKKHSRQSSTIETGKDDLRASLKVIGWLNETLDALAQSVGKQASRDAALALLILYKNHKTKNGKKFLQSYRAWQHAPKSQTVEESLGVALAQLLLADLVTVKIELTDEGLKTIEAMRKKINRRLREVGKDLTGSQRRIFNTLITDSLPLPPPKLPPFRRGNRH